MRTRAGDVAHHHSDNADLTPRIVREGVSGVISAQWSCRGHWMEVGLQGHHRIVHCYCPFLREDDTDQMRLANVHNFTKLVDELLFQVELQGLKL